MKLLITGGCGFIGSNFIRYILKKYPHYKIINLDSLTYAGNLESLEDVSKNPNYTFIKGDISDCNLVMELIDSCEGVLNFAAETHVDRSITDPSIFVRTNVLGTQILLEASRRKNIPRFLQVSTDEVYGSIEKGAFTEESLLLPNSPYAASKAGADHLVRAYHKTYRLPVIITRSSNNFGPYQYPEKIIPLFIMKAFSDEKLPLYGDGLNVRDWIYVEDNCTAIDLVFHKGREGEIYNIGGGNEMGNIEIARMILKELKRPESLISYVKDRPGHDRRYALNPNKIKEELGWEPANDFENAIKRTIYWYKDNINWCKKVLNKYSEQ
ncbi:MAG: dTDP-glucose 4,6-dehydratase [Nitrospirota bacterium]